MLRPKDLAQIADDEIIARADLFVVSWFVGRSPETYRRAPIVREALWVRKEFDTLVAAIAARNAAGRDRYGRYGVIYAADTARDISVFVDDQYLERTKPKLTRPTRTDPITRPTRRE